MFSFKNFSLIILILSASIPAVRANGISYGANGSSGNRIVPLEVKVVFVGFSTQYFDLQYLLWRENLPNLRSNQLLTSNNATGVTYNVTYRIVFTEESFRQELTKYLNSIGQRKFLYNPWFQRDISNTIYNATLVEDWLASHDSGYGGKPSNGYTFIFANMTTVPSVNYRQLDDPRSFPPTPHYYRTPYADVDLGYQLRYREFGVGWGGNSRLWFLDFAAGPEFWTWVNPEAVPHLPLQVALEIFKIDVHNEQGKLFLSQYLSDYILDATWDLAVPQFVYEPKLTQSYKIKISIFDNRTSREREKVNIASTIKADVIKAAIQELVPYANVTVDFKIAKLEDVPDLYRAVKNSTYNPPEDLRIGTYVDVRQLHFYLQSHLKQLVPDFKTDDGVVTFPVFAFAFQAGIYFAFTQKWQVSSHSQEVASFTGISLGDMSIVGMTQDEFLRGNYIYPQQPNRGLGFTQAILHEVGHDFGLAHPHEFSYLQDFVSSAMSYYTWEYKFSIFEKDALQRAHADQRLIHASQSLQKAQQELSGRFALPQTLSTLQELKDAMDASEAAYKAMNYQEAVNKAMKADNLAARLLIEISQLASLLTTSSLISLILGIAIGFAVMFLAFGRYTKIMERRIKRLETPQR